MLWCDLARLRNYPCFPFHQEYHGMSVTMTVKVSGEPYTAPPWQHRPTWLSTANLLLVFLPPKDTRYENVMTIDFLNLNLSSTQFRQESDKSAITMKALFSTGAWHQSGTVSVKMQCSAWSNGQVRDEFKCLNVVFKMASIRRNDHVIIQPVVCFSGSGSLSVFKLAVEYSKM